MARRGRGRPRRRPARRPRAPLHARRALPQGQPLPRRPERPRARDPPAAPGRRQGRGRFERDRLGRGDRQPRPQACARRSSATAPSRCCRTTSPAPRAWCRAGSWARACSRRSAPRACGRRSARPPPAPRCDATYGGSVGMDPEDFEYARLVILWGANLLSTNLHQWRFVLAAQRRGRARRRDRPAAHRHRRALRRAPRAATRHRCGARARADARRARRGRRGPRVAHALHRGLARARGAPGRVAGRARRRDLRAAGRGRASRSAGGFAHTRPTAIRLGLGLQRHGGAGAAMRAILAAARADRRLPARRRRRPVHDGRPLRRHRRRPRGGARRSAGAARAHDQHVAPRARR